MKTLKQLLKPLKLNSVNSKITEENFPRPEELGEVELFHFDEVLSTDEVLKKINEQGYRPANLYELLGWAKNWDRKYWVVALGSVWRHPRPCLDGHGTGRLLALHWLDDDWLGNCRFAAVRKSLETKTLEIKNPLTLCPHCKKEIKYV